MIVAVVGILVAVVVNLLDVVVAVTVGNVVVVVTAVVDVDVDSVVCCFRHLHENKNLQLYHVVFEK